MCTGVLAGLALRFGAPIYLPLPEVIFSLLSHTAGETAADSGALEEDATQTLSLALRTGLVSTFPEVCVRYIHLFIYADIITLHCTVYSQHWTCSLPRRCAACSTVAVAVDLLLHSCYSAGLPMRHLCAQTTFMLL